MGFTIKLQTSTLRCLTWHSLRRRQGISGINNLRTTDACLLTLLYGTCCTFYASYRLNNWSPCRFFDFSHCHLTISSSHHISPPYRLTALLTCHTVVFTARRTVLNLCSTKRRNELRRRLLCCSWLQTLAPLRVEVFDI